MDLSAGYLIASLLLSSVGFAAFLFGKKQQRIPHLVGGIILMACPYFVTSPEWLYALGSATTVAIWGAVRQGL